MTSVLQSQHEHYAEVRRRLMGGSTPPERPRHWVEPKEQPHRPDLPPPLLPYVRLAVPAVAECDTPTKPVRRQRDYIIVSSPDFHIKSSTHRILRECCAKHRVTMQELRGPKRFVNIVWARQEAAYRMSRETRLSLSQIGKRLGDRDHTTILHAIRCYEARLEGREYRKPRGKMAHG